jgi:predicted HicB family RNase H-like nuclease
MLNYKGYVGHVEFDDEAEIFHGEVINTRDVITFQGLTVAEIKQAFTESVDDYLDYCAERGEQPDKPFSGKFNLRLDPSLHRQLYIKAKQMGTSLNQFVIDAIQDHLHERHA